MYKTFLLCLIMGFFLTAVGQNKVVDPAGLAPKGNLAPIKAAPGEVMNVYPQSVAYWTGYTEGTTKTDNTINTVFPNVGWAVFDLSTLPSGVLITGLTYYGYVNSTVFPYWSGTPMGTVNPVSDDAATINSQIQANYGSSIAYIYSTSNLSTGWYSSPLGNNAVTDFQSAISQGWFAMGFVDWDFSTSYYVNFDGWNDANPPYIEVSYLLATPGDVATESIDMPSMIGLGASTPMATVFNYSDVAESFDVTMTIGSYTSTKTVTNLASLTAQQVTFDSWDPALGDYTVDVCTQLAGDPNSGNDCLSQPISVVDLTPVFAYNAYDPGGTPEGIVTYFEEDASTISLVAPTSSAAFICAGTVGDGGAWYGLQYNGGTGFQPLYSITTAGDMTMIGTTDVSPSINGIAWDPTTDTYYGISYSPNNLYTIDITTGSCTLVGQATAGSELFISLACSPTGQLYALELNAASLFAVDKTTGAATIIGPLGVSPNYAQDMGFDQNTGILYWAAYTSSGEWRTIDPTTGASTYIGPLGGSGAEMCALNLPWQVIPVEFTAFNANVSDNNVVLDWVTATETNNSGFEVQRNSGSGYEVLGFVQGNGTSTEKHSYSFVDNSVKSGTYSYRLRQIDFDGTTDFSKVVEVTVGTPSVFGLTQNYPNPFNPSTVINYSLAVDSKVTLKVFDVLGQEVATLLNGNISAGIHNVTFDASKLNSGVYLYKIEANGTDGNSFTSVKKMILTK